MSRALLALALVAVLGAAGAQAATRKLTLYAKATRAQFINHADDRSRGITQNPFNADVKALAPLTKQKEQGAGPFPGDSARYSFKLYRDAGLTKAVGSAVYACTFNFGHHALCEADYELTGGSMFASGPADFDATHFTLAVTGGTSKYLGARGQVSSAPTVRDAHRLDFVLR